MKTVSNNKTFVAVLSLLALSVITVFVRAYADNAGAFIKPYMGTYYTKELSDIAPLPWWRLLLPLPEFEGRWGTTGFLLVHWLETIFGEPRAFYLLNVTMVVCGYIFTYLIFRSLLLAFLFGFGLASSTFNYHVYVISGSMNILPTMCFLFLFSYCQVEWMRRPLRSWIWAAATFLSCILFAVAYEGWLDLMPAIWIIYPVLCFFFWRRGDVEHFSRSVFSLLSTSTIAIAYFAIKKHYGLDGLHPVGGEADLITTYGFDHKTLMIEDIVSNYFTFFFTTITTYFPPQIFSFSMSSWLYGADGVVRLQEGYHPQATHLTHYNHLFLWRYYAGSFLALFGLAYVGVIKRLFSSFEEKWLVVFVLLTITLIGSPTHMMIKWRPMHAAPFLGYQCYLSIAGFTLLLCYLVVERYNEWSVSRGVLLVTALVLDFSYCAYARPALLSYMSQEVFMAPYPDPKENLRRLLNRS